jgi:hypothetical protein
MQVSVQGLSRDAIARNRRSIKRTLSANSFFQFISADLLKIREFSRQNGIIHFTFFVFMRLDGKLPERFIQQIQRTLAEPLHKALYPVVENGWRVLEKKEYNQVVFIHDFAREVAAITPEHLHNPPAKILEIMRGVEQAFLILSSEPALLAELERQLELYAKLGHVQNFPVDSIIRAIQMLLSRTPNRLTLYSLFVSLNSMVSRRFLDIQDITNPDRRQYFSAEDFDLDDHGRLLLINYQHEVVVSINKHLRHHEEISLFQGLIPINEGRTSSHDISILKQFYNTGGGDQDRFNADWSNILGFLVEFSQKVIVQFKRFLTADFKVKGGGDKLVQVFDKTLFSNYLVRIGYIKDKLDKLLLKTPKFERTRYLRVLSEGNLSVNAGEEPLISNISELLNIFFQISRTLALILKHGSHSKNPENVPMLRAISWRDVQFFIPYEKSIQYSSVFLAGQSVRDAMETIASLLLLTCLELRESELVTILRKDMHTMDSLKKLFRELKRICTPQQYQEYDDELDLSRIEQEMT